MKRQVPVEGHPDLIKTYSDAGFMVRNVATDELYAEAIDPISAHREYTETDIPVDEEEPTVEEKAEAYDILVGVRE